jgi:hypothetical protein
MQNHEYLKLGFLTVGTALMGIGCDPIIKFVLKALFDSCSMDSDLFLDGIILFVLGSIIFLIGLRLKNKHQIILDYLQKALKFAEKKAQTKVVWKNDFELLESSKVTDADYSKFRNEVINAIGLAYVERESLRFKDEIVGVYNPFNQTQTSGKTVNEQIESVKEGFKKLAAYLKMFPDIRDFGSFIRPEFDPDDLKKYSEFMHQK